MMHRLFIPALAIAAMLAGCETYSGDQPGYGHAAYREASPEEQWEASHYYREGPYEERTLSRDDRIYRGDDGRYYCRRSDGTAGLIVGGLAGGALGDIIAPRGSKTLGTVLGAVGGAAIGSAVDQNNVRCR